MRKDTFNIIQFDSLNKDEDTFMPAHIESTGLWRELVEQDFFKDLLIQRIPMGESRYGGAIIDFPTSVKLPDLKKLSFVAQIDCKEFARFDKNKMFPKSGYLYFFTNIKSKKGETIYFDGGVKSLERVFLKSSSQTWGTLNILSNIRASKQCWTDQFDKLFSDELKCVKCKTKNFLDCKCNNTGDLPYSRKEIVSREYVWSIFKISECSKVFGIYTDLQKELKEIEKITFSNKIVLFQVGSDINTEGVFSVLIDRDHLKKLDFSKCEYVWSQT